MLLRLHPPGEPSFVSDAAMHHSYQESVRNHDVGCCDVESAKRCFDIAGVGADRRARLPACKAAYAAFSGARTDLEGVFTGGSSGGVHRTWRAYLLPVSRFSPCFGSSCGTWTWLHTLPPSLFDTPMVGRAASWLAVLCLRIAMRGERILHTALGRNASSGAWRACGEPSQPTLRYSPQRR